MARKRTKKRGSTISGRKHKSAPRRRRGMSARRRKRSGLSELMTPAGAMAAGRGILGGAAGGFAGGILQGLVKDQSPIVRIGVGAVGSALIYALVGPNVGAGMAGGITAIETATLRTQFMNEGGDYADPDALNQLPPVLNENGDPMTLMEADGELYYLDEATGDSYLAEEVYPQYAAND